MNELSQVLRRDEQAVLSLRALYRRYGYRQYQLSRFEEYDLYARNKGFLVSEAVLTFTDPTGRLLALKPDVTLSIIRNSKDDEPALQKLYYHENVYRAPRPGDGFREITQVGLECIGQVDGYAVGEVLLLAAESLRTVSRRWALDLSHLGFLSALLDEIAPEAAVRGALLRCIGAKNPHELQSVCARSGIAPADCARLQTLSRLHGPFGPCLETLSRLSAHPRAAAALEELRGLCAFLEAAGLSEQVMLDFSIVNDMRYYNGVIFQGFVEGIPGSILSGGRYDRLMEKMGKRGQAIGFAVYLDQLERLQPAEPFRVDTLLLYDDGAEPRQVLSAMEQLRRGGRTVRADRRRSDAVAYRQLARLGEEGLEILETDN